MNEKTITKRNAGKIFTKFSNSKEPGYSVPRKFLQDFAEEFASVSSKYIGKHNILVFPPFGFRERQLNTILSPVFHNMCDYHLQEAPTYRAWTQLTRDDTREDSHGWTDFLCMYNGYAFLVEFKQSHISYESGVPNKHSAKDLWPTLHEQIKSSKSDSYWYRDKCKGVFRLGLHIMPIYKSTKKKNFVFNCVSNKMDDILDNISAQFRPKPSFLSMWSLNKNLQGPYLNDDEEKYYYPGVSMAGILTKVIPKKK